MTETIQSFRLLVHNVQNRRGEPVGLREARLRGLAALYRAETPDFVCLQECPPTYHRIFEDELGPRWSGYVPRDTRGEDEGCPIYVTGAGWQAERFDFFWLSRTPDVPSLSWRAAHNRVVSELVVAGRGGTLRILNTHLDHRSRCSRRRGFQLIRERLRGNGSSGAEGGGFVLCGDFNTGPASLHANGLTGAPGGEMLPADGLLGDAAGVRPSQGRRGTFRGILGGRLFESRIDYCLYGPGLMATDYRVVEPGSRSNWLSDHRLLVADLAWRMRESDPG